ncbi:hypothetical protein AMTR_s00022p00164220 [Amborella trichopoda]|uniref:Uncharacterized protein n=1 Tax=Amborella trichopoda TaxID=13333 RepID=W1PU26_AMBTC|nr:hypothetical protein AMTR_s00022p00164220 [Amborella trichopoda]
MGVLLPELGGATPQNHWFKLHACKLDANPQEGVERSIIISTTWVSATGVLTNNGTKLLDVRPWNVVEKIMIISATGLSIPSIMTNNAMKSVTQVTSRQARHPMLPSSWLTICHP